MTNGSLISNNGIKIAMNRTYQTVPDYLEPTQFKISISNGTPNISDTALDYIIPIENGTVCDNGDQQFTGSDGGDNTTDNTTTYKEGAGATDGKAQDLIANDTNATKTWTSPDLDVAGSDMVDTQPFAIWLYIKDATALAKFLTAGTCLELRIRTNGDAANLYYTLTKTVADLAIGWNWVSSDTTIISGLTQGAGGPPSGDLNEFVIIITTNNATDTFTTGDVIYDLLRQWATTDVVKDFVNNYPTFDYTTKEVTTRCYLDSTEANGFDLNAFAMFNEDATPLMHSEDVFTSDSKSSTDEFAFIVRDRFIN